MGVKKTYGLYIGTIRIHDYKSGPLQREWFVIVRPEGYMRRHHEVPIQGPLDTPRTITALSYRGSEGDPRLGPQQVKRRNHTDCGFYFFQSRPGLYVNLGNKFEFYEFELLLHKSGRHFYSLNAHGEVHSF